MNAFVMPSAVALHAAQRTCAWVTGPLLIASIHFISTITTFVFSLRDELLFYTVRKQQRSKVFSTDQANAASEVRTKKAAIRYFIVQIEQESSILNCKLHGQLTFNRKKSIFVGYFFVNDKIY